MEQKNISVEASPAQLNYATLLHYGSLLGFAALLITFTMYAFGFSIAPAHIPVVELEKTWHLSSAEFNKLHNVPTGWGWVNLLATGDFANFIGIAILAGVTIFCYIKLALDFFAVNDKLMGTIAVIEVIVLTLAASGLVAGGH